MSISVLRSYLSSISMPLEDLKLLIANGAAQEAGRIGVEKYHCVLAHPSLPTHPNWTVRVFDARGKGLYLGGLHINEHGVGDFMSVDEELDSKHKNKTLNRAFHRRRRLIFCTIGYADIRNSNLKQLIFLVILPKWLRTNFFPLIQLLAPQQQLSAFVRRELQTGGTKSALVCIISQ
ncbi:hypothetical protein HYPSUDRAFT_208576 [Hypholoma sublateritium FD-334 SS-4]|uniref:Uncharacterized protein n=1 Tax=Hypholoma sublateritium (strain FD-334 SS-4) TaxID=945553 RepID=A0A0D2P1U1_HYPSF|nr:hypothetical protein HYPSUDRAFT_208576 [Hypholoma sublateritium FD-334 SS-4]